MSRMRRSIVVSLALAMSGGVVAASPADAAPPSAARVAYDDLYVHAECSATGVAGIYLVTGQVAPRLPLTNATFTCTLNGLPAVSLPTPNGLLGSALPLLGALTPVLTPAPTQTALGVGFALGDEVRLCVTVDVVVTVPLLPPITEHVERCS